MRIIHGVLTLGLMSCLSLQVASARSSETSRDSEPAICLPKDTVTKLTQTLIDDSHDTAVLQELFTEIEAAAQGVNDARGPLHCITAIRAANVSLQQLQDHRHHQFDTIQRAAWLKLAAQMHTWNAKISRYVVWRVTGCEHVSRDVALLVWQTYCVPPQLDLQRIKNTVKAVRKSCHHIGALSLENKQYLKRVHDGVKFGCDKKLVRTYAKTTTQPDGASLSANTSHFMRVEL